jgi:CMP-N-acetylneuraminic acid synthetase
MVDEALLDTLGYLEGDEPDIVLRLQPTSPLRTAEQIDRGVRVIQHGTGGARAAVAVVEARHHPFLIGDFAVDGFMGLDERFRLPRQEYPTAYAISGAFYGARTDYWLQHGFYGPDSVALPWSRESSVDIDGPLDLVIAEALLSRRLAGAA